MNPILHHKWNSERDPERGSNKEGEPISLDTVAKNKVALKQSKPR